MSPAFTRRDSLALGLSLVLATATPSSAQGGATTRGAAAQDAVVTVGEVQITAGDLREEMNRMIPLAFFHRRVPQEQLHAMRAQAVESLVEKALVFQDARARGLAASEDEIRVEFDKTLAVARKSDPRLRDVPEADRAKLLAQYRPLVVRRILLDKNEARFTASVPAATEDEIRGRYGAAKDQILGPAEAHLLHLMVRLSPMASETELQDGRKRIEAAHKEILEGRPFEEVARRVCGESDAKSCGDLGVVREGSFLRGALDKAAFALKEGEVSAIVDTRYGFHVVKCLKKIPPRQLSLAEARARLEAELTAERTSDLRARWIARLKEQFPVKFHAEDPTGIPSEAGRPTPGSHPASQPGSRRR